MNRPDVFRCSNCRAVVEQTDKFCRGCGATFSKGDPGSNSIGGDSNSGNFQNTGVIQDSNIQFNYGHDNRIPVHFRRVKDTDLGIRPWQMITVGALPALTGVVGFVGSIASIAALPKALLPVFVLLLMLGLALVLIGLLVKRRGFAEVPIPVVFQGRAFESDGDGFIHWTKIEAVCPFCPRASRMKLRDHKDARGWRKKLVCVRNHHHVLLFDHTALPELA